MRGADGADAGGADAGGARPLNGNQESMERLRAFGVAARVASVEAPLGFP